ncbi:MAG: polysaccharide deacetylase family protein [Rhizobiaceae bacterium]|nr:polysaccharide deacetylase family protein [Rhizobiaceae bacterium]
MLDGGEAIRKLVLNVARLSGIAPIAGSFVGGVGAILMLHRVTSAPSAPLGINRHLAVTPAFLDALIADMKKRGYVFVSLDEAVGRLAAGGGRERFATITADDGYRDNLTEALPILERHEAPCTIYVAPSLINGTVELWWDLIEELVTGRDWVFLNTPQGRVSLDCSSPQKKLDSNARLHEYLTEVLPEEEQRNVVRSLAIAAGVDPDRHRREVLMNWDEVRKVAAHPLLTVGAHTVNHYNLRRLGRDKALAEMVNGARILEIETGVKPKHLAFPYGYPAAVGSREVALAAEAGFVSAVTTRHGVLRPEHKDHLHALPRISINGRYQRVGHVRTMLSGVTTPLANSGKVVVTV